MQTFSMTTTMPYSTGKQTSKSLLNEMNQHATSYKFSLPYSPKVILSAIKGMKNNKAPEKCKHPHS